MDRRTFLKALLFTVPGLYVHPLTCISDSLFAEVSTEPEQEFIVYFIGDYGARVLKHFRYLKACNPILNKCDHISMDVNSDEGFITVSDYRDPIDLIVKASRCQVACFVLDSRQAEALALVEIISTFLRKNEQGILICLTPVISHCLKTDLFNLMVETYSPGSDLSAELLLTLYNTYLGCGRMGNLQCLKFWFDMMDIPERHLIGKVGVAIDNAPSLDQIDVPRLVQTTSIQLERSLHESGERNFICISEVDKDASLQLFSRFVGEINRVIIGLSVAKSVMTEPEEWHAHMILFHCSRKAGAKLTVIHYVDTQGFKPWI